MRCVSISAPDFQYDADDPEGFRAGMFRFGPMVGGSRLGASVYELPPGQSICPYHYEYREEEWLIVLEGRPTLREPEGTAELEPWDVVCFPTGPEGAHGLRNDSDTPVRYVVAGVRVSPEVVEYPDLKQVTGQSRHGIFFIHDVEEGR